MGRCHAESRPIISGCDGLAMHTERRRHGPVSASRRRYSLATHDRPGYMLAGAFPRRRSRNQLSPPTARRRGSASITRRDTVTASARRYSTERLPGHAIQGIRKFRRTMYHVLIITAPVSKCRLRHARPHEISQRKESRRAASMRWRQLATISTGACPQTIVNTCSVYAP
jgi:hypothetical protein